MAQTTKQQLDAMAVANSLRPTLLNRKDHLVTARDMSDPAKHLLMSLFACVFFGYSTINCLVFYRRTRSRVEQYSNRRLEGLVHSSQYNWTLWTSGVVGVIGFAISSWQLVLNAIALLHARN